MKTLYAQLSPIWHVTGGSRSINMAAQECRYPQYGTVPQFLAGGPLDAPEVLPAGGMNSVTDSDYLTGQAMPAMTLCKRDDTTKEHLACEAMRTQTHLPTPHGGRHTERPTGARTTARRGASC